jgi:iron complex transport system substrate-binding protein
LAVGFSAFRRSVHKPLLLILVIACAAAQAATLEIQDDRGKTVRLAAPAARIISIAPHLTEIAFAAGAGKKIVAVSEYSDYPPEARRLPRVGDGARVDIERILTLKPDLVIAWKSGNQAGDIARLERMGIAVWVSEPSRLADIPRLLRDVGALAGAAADGERAASEFESELQRLRNRYRSPTATQKSLRVFYEIWHQPLLTINGRHMISDAITLCGGTNVFAEVPVLTPAMSLESVLAAHPQLVLGGGSANGEADFQARWRGMRLAALRAIPAHYIAPDSIQRQSPRIIDGIRSICAQVDAARKGGETGAGSTPR